MELATIAGEYYLQGQMEMASGFLLQPDGGFQFFLSYGALDRQGRGQWEIKNNEIILNSEPRPPYDFALLKSSVEPNDFTTFKIEMPDPSLVRYVFCSLQNGTEGSWTQMEPEGISFPKQPVDSVSLLFQFCSERFSTIPVSNPEHNAFVFRSEPTLLDVCLKNFSLQVLAGELSGGHPIMEGDKFRYEKL